MSLDNRTRNRKSHSHAVAFGREKGCEDCGWVSKPNARVAYLDMEHAIIASPKLDGQLPLTIVDEPHGLNGIENEIDQHLLNLDAIRPNAGVFDHLRRGEIRGSAVLNLQR